MAEFVTPRVNSGLIKNFVNANVRIVGKVVASPANGFATISASDGGNVRINTLAESEWTDSFVEVIGKVNADGSMTELFSTGFGNNFGIYSIKKIF